jgi:FdhD protein
MPAEASHAAATIQSSFQQLGADQSITSIERIVAVECPIAIEFNGIGYAVLMATPADLEDLVYGFALTERLINDASDVIDIGCFDAANGTIVRATLAGHCLARLTERVRHRISESSCGLCGIENLEQALRPLPLLSVTEPPENGAIFVALSALETLQPFNKATGGVHGAAACYRDGQIRIVREDVGRHNAFDKLIGAMLRTGLTWDGGFALLSSRCSYELVEKAVLSRCPMLATISVPTGLAIDRATAAGLRLAVLARPDSVLILGD